MKIKFIDIKTTRSDKDKILLCFWLYLLLLLFEGAFRKWILPEASNLFLVIRDPIVIYVMYLGIKNHLFTNAFGRFFLAITVICFLTSLLWGHQNLLVALYGFRITGLHIPTLFIWGNVLRRKDILYVGKFTLYCSVLMCIVIAWQYFTPQSSWINRAVGSGDEGSGFSGVAGYFRPSGTFSFITGIIGFYFLTGVYLFYFLYTNKYLATKDKLSNTLLTLFLTVFLIGISLSLSRSVITGTALILLTCLFSSILLKKEMSKTIGIIFLIVILFIILYNFSFFQLTIDNIINRFISANGEKGNFMRDSIGNRFFGSYIRAFTDTQNFSGKEIPFWGFGLGSGSKVGSMLLHYSLGRGFGLAEEEWSLTICEQGLFLGGVLLMGRLLFPIYYSIISVKLLIRNRDFLPYIFIPFICTSFINYQLSVPTLLGFTVVAGALMMAAIRTSKKINHGN